MATRFGPGPVFAYEWLTASRRWQGYAIRSAFVAILLAGMGVAWMAGRDRSGPSAAPGMNRLAAVGRATATAIVGTQLVLVLLIAPASTAGAVCADRSSGALTHLLTTDLSSSEIVLGKLLARLVPVLGLVLCTLPVALLATLLGGADPDSLVRASAVTVGVATLGGAAGLLASAWAGRGQDALMAVYACWAAWLIAGPALGEFAPMPARAELLHPFILVLAPFGATGRGGWGDVLAFLATAAAASALLVTLAIASVRSAERRGAPAVASPPAAGAGPVARLLGVPGRWGPCPSLDDNPVLWREWHRGRPSRWGRAVWWAYGLASVAFTIAAAWRASGGPIGAGVGMFTHIGIGLQASIGLLLLCVAASASLAEERSRGSLDVLMAVPLPTSAIVWGKWWGAARALPWLAAPAALIPAASALRTGWWAGPIVGAALMLAYGAAFVSLGLALATLIRRPGRAIALTVALYLLPTAGWFFLILALVRDKSGAMLAMGSPFYGPIFGLRCALDGYWAPDSTWAALATWSFAYGSAAALLQASTLMGFDRRMGRMPEGRNPRPPAPPPGRPAGPGRGGRRGPPLTASP